MSRWAAARIVQTVRERPDALLGLATGSTPTQTYQLLAARARREPSLFRALRILKLDEWGGLAFDDPATCEVYLKRHVLDPLGIEAKRYFGWHSRPASPRLECARFARWLDRHGPIDLCVLGLGLNGHVLFNEPADALVAAPHVARLSAESLNHTMVRRNRIRPRYGLTLGFAGVLQSQAILLLVSGAGKSRQLRRLLDEPMTPRFPASFLQLHPNLTVVCDRAAAGTNQSVRTPRNA
jgi:galactosamine-6-phosphate isomerase